MTDPMTLAEEHWLSPGVVGIGTACFLTTPGHKMLPTGVRRSVS